MMNTMIMIMMTTALIIMMTMMMIVTIVMMMMMNRLRLTFSCLIQAPVSSLCLDSYLANTGNTQLRSSWWWRQCWWQWWLSLWWRSLGWIAGDIQLYLSLCWTFTRNYAIHLSQCDNSLATVLSVSHCTTHCTAICLRFRLNFHCTGYRTNSGLKRTFLAALADLYTWLVTDQWLELALKGVICK